MRINK